MRGVSADPWGEEEDEEEEEDPSKIGHWLPPTGAAAA
jgi:hypothetical protein